MYYTKGKIKRGGVKFILEIIFFVFLCAIYINSTTFFRLKLADYYTKNREYDKAIATYKKILRKETLNAKHQIRNMEHISYIHLALANLLLIRNRFTESAQTVKKIIEINPAYKITPLAESENPLWYYQLGLVYHREHRDNDATKQFETSLEKISKISIKSTLTLPDYLGDIYYRLGINFERNGDVGNAVDYYKKAIELDGNRAIEAYYRLKLIYKKQGKLEDFDSVETKLLNLKPEYEVNYKFSDDLILLGYSLNEREFELFNNGKITFFWEVGSQNSEVSYEINKLSNIYKIRNRLYEIKEVENLAPNFGFEVDPQGQGFPEAWDTDIYMSAANSHEIVFDMNFLNQITQCLLLNNTEFRSTNCETDYIAIVEKKFYLQAAWIKSINGRAYLGRPSWEFLAVRH